MAKQKDRLLRKHTYYSKIKYTEKRYYSTKTKITKKNHNKTILQKILLVIKDIYVGGFNGIIWINTFFFTHFTWIVLVVILTIITYVYYDYNIIITNILGSILISVTFFLFSLNLSLYYLDGLEISNVRYIKYIQIFTFISTPFILIIFAYNHISVDIINCVKNDHVAYNINNLNNNTYIANKSMKNILLHLQIVNYISITAIIFLVLLIFYKFHLKKNISNICIWLPLFILILTLVFFVYNFNDLYININSYVNMYINLRK